MIQYHSIRLNSQFYGGMITGGKNSLQNSPNEILWNKKKQNNRKLGHIFSQNDCYCCCCCRYSQELNLILNYPEGNLELELSTIESINDDDYQEQVYESNRLSWKILEFFIFYISGWNVPWNVLQKDSGEKKITNEES
ncbi:hypothetical protein DERF_012049 [Dermatophagoides farinae]|uniref:Uncharacterized protein n=1 Tax=Dermatophagoides farinae TaxID=6954 RepID=A0A922HP56_DERFA|nr:hypothetical protein DERF_012049 [Dermatophagoides farinae]